jgi:hypothetical protein
MAAVVDEPTMRLAAITVIKPTAALRMVRTL